MKDYYSKNCEKFTQKTKNGNENEPEKVKKFKKNCSVKIREEREFRD